MAAPLKPGSAPPRPEAGPSPSATTKGAAKGQGAAKPGPPAEVGGPKGPEPTRYGDWERDGRCVDF